MSNSQKLIIFAAPSGAGKTTISKHLLKTFPDKLSFSISATTRQPRINEVDGKDYYFITKEEFLHRIAQKKFIEFEEVYSGTFYGTLKTEVDRIWKDKKHVIFDIDVEGGLHLKKKYGNDALAIFVQPPSMEVLAQRLASRGTDNETKIKERLTKAKTELTYAGKFDVILKNCELKETFKVAESLTRNFIE